MVQFDSRIRLGMWWFVVASVFFFFFVSFFLAGLKGSAVGPQEGDGRTGQLGK